MNNAMNGTETMPSKKSLVFSCLITVLAAACLVAAFFLPLVSARGEYREQLKEYAKAMDELENLIDSEETDANTSELVGSVMDVSMLDYAKEFGNLSDDADSTDILSTVLLYGPGVIALIILLFALLKKPILVIVFNMLSGGTCYLTISVIMEWIQDKYYTCGIAFYLYPIGTVIVFIGAIWMLIAKIQRKRKIKALRKVSE